MFRFDLSSPHSSTTEESEKKSAGGSSGGEPDRNTDTSTGEGYKLEKKAIFREGLNNFAKAVQVELTLFDIKSRSASTIPQRI